MVLFNYSTRELTAKVVFYGPGLCGKTTNLQYIYDNLPKDVSRGKMLSLATKTDRTLFFDFLPLDLGTIRGMKTRIQLYTVPGQVFYNSTRKMVLKGADGMVFVADSQAKMMDANIESFANLEENLAEQGMRLEQMPLVLQFNKRDLPGLASIEELNSALNKYNAPFYEAIAVSGIGVHDTLKAATKLVLNVLTNKYRLDKDRGIRAATPARAAASAAPASAPASTQAKPAASPEPAPAPLVTPVAVAEETGEDAVLELVEEGADGEVLELVEEEPRPADPGATMRLSTVDPSAVREKQSPRHPLSMEPGLAELEIIPLEGQAQAQPQASPPAPSEAEAKPSQGVRPAPSQAEAKPSQGVRPAPSEVEAKPSQGVRPAPSEVEAKPLQTIPPIPEAPPTAAAKAPPAWLESGGDAFPALEESTPATDDTAQPIVLKVAPGESPSVTLPLRIEMGERTFEYMLKIQLQSRGDH